MEVQSYLICVVEPVNISFLFSFDLKAKRERPCQKKKLLEDDFFSEIFLRNVF